MNNTPDTQLVGIDILDAAEIAQICHYITAWITQAPAAVTESLACHGASPTAPTLLIDALDHYADLLERLVPTSPTKVTTTAPLSPGEALGLAEFLIDMAINGWPPNPAHVEAIQHDCRRWALRLAHTPGVIP